MAGATISSAAISASGDVETSQQLKTTATTDSTSSTTGALQTAGGLGVKEKSTFGGDVTTEGAVIATGSEATPASATATCVKGQLQWDANYVYMCTASNTWKRSALSTWA